MRMHMCSYGLDEHPKFGGKVNTILGGGRNRPVISDASIHLGCTNQWQLPGFDPVMGSGLPQVDTCESGWTKAALR
jgi:hypothetical protein